MTAASLVLGLDVSTTGTKAMLMERDGTVVAIAAAEYDFETPFPLWAEQDPSLWWEAAQSTIAEVLDATGRSADDVVAVGAGGQMHGMVLLDEDDQVIRPAILWNDGRTAAQGEAMLDAVGRERFIAVTGNDALVSFTATKMLWVREHEPENWARARHLLLPKDYVRFMLTGEHALDVNDGAGTVLFDLQSRTWSDEIVAALGIDRAMLPRTVEGPEVVGVVTEAAAAATGLRAGTPVVGGAGDQAANAVGMGAVVPGIAAMSVGTSGVIFVPTAGPSIEPDGRLQAFCHAVPGAWHLMGVTMSAAGSLKWLRDELAPDDRLGCADGAGGGGAAGLRGPHLPALPVGRACALSRPARARCLHRPDRAPRAGTHGAGRARGRGLLAARRVRAGQRRPRPIRCLSCVPPGAAPTRRCGARSSRTCWACPCR